MSVKSDEAYALLGLINGHMLLEWYAAEANKPMPVYISYRPQELGRAYQSAAWRVYRPGYKTDDSEKPYWRDHGVKTFNVRRDTRAEQLEVAKAWAAEKFGVTEWKKTNRLRTTGSYFPVEVVDFLEAAIKRLKKEAK